LQAAASGKHQNRERILALAYLAQDGEPVAIGQSEVENHGGVAGRR
jgi:hypothetical protein